MVNDGGLYRKGIYDGIGSGGRFCLFFLFSFLPFFQSWAVTNMDLQCVVFMNALFDCLYVQNYGLLVGVCMCGFVVGMGCVAWAGTCLDMF